MLRATNFHLEEFKDIQAVVDLLDYNNEGFSELDPVEEIEAIRALAYKYAKIIPAPKSLPKENWLGYTANLIYYARSGRESNVSFVIPLLADKFKKEASASGLPYEFYVAKNLDLMETALKDFSVLSEDGLDLVEVFEGLLSCTLKFPSKAEPIVPNKDKFLLWVSNSNKIAYVSESVADFCGSFTTPVEYTDNGLAIGGELLRLHNDFAGAVVDDFIL